MGLLWGYYSENYGDIIADKGMFVKKNLREGECESPTYSKLSSSLLIPHISTPIPYPYPPSPISSPHTSLSAQLTSQFQLSYLTQFSSLFQFPLSIPINISNYHISNLYIPFMLSFFTFSLQTKHLPL